MRQTLRILAAVILVLAAGISAAAQSRTVTGKVTDRHGVPVISAMVLEKGTTNGAATDLDGNYSIRVNGDVTLEKGPYSVKEAVLTSLGEEGVAGKVTCGTDLKGFSAADKSVKVTLPAAVDCSASPAKIPIVVAPVSLSKGFKIVFSLEGGKTVEFKSSEAVDFAAGGSSLNIYKLNDWDGAKPSLVLERTVPTGSYVTGNHDMTLLDENTLVIAGNGAATYNMANGIMAKLPHFSKIVGMKSINVNPASREAYYTYASEGTSEGDYAWSSHKIRYTANVDAADGGSDAKLISVSDINMYKVRVLSW